MLLTKRRFFVPVLLAFLTLFLSVVACSLPDETLEQVGEGLASIDFFVATTGIDTNDCQTRETACRSLGRALGVVNELPENPLTIIHIASGSYDEVNDLHINKSMTLLGSDEVIINLLPTPGAGPDAAASFFVRPPASGTVRVEEVTIQGGSEGVVVESGRLELSHVKLRNITNRAISAQGVTTNIMIQNSEISDVGNAPIVTSGAGVNITIQATSIHDNNGTAIINYGSSFVLDGVRIFNNNAANHAVSAIYNTYEGVSTATPGAYGSVRISNSAIYGNANSFGGDEYYAIRHEGQLLEMSNSTISGNAGNGIYLYVRNDAETILTHVTVANHPGVGISGGGLIKLVNSLIVYNGWDCGMRVFVPVGSSEINIAAEGNLDSDNTCIDLYAAERAAWDFNPGVDSVLSAEGVHPLQPDSPAVDAVDCILSNDQRGVARPQGLRCDIGAYEHSVALGEPPISPSMTPFAIVQGTTTAQATLPVVQTQISISATPASNPFVRFITGANCRSGPGTVYSIITALPEGTEAPAEGRNNDNTWWWIFVGSNTRCWVSAATVETFGLVTGLPVIPAPPTPVPTSTPVPPAATATTAPQPPSAPGQLFIENRVCNGQSYTVSLSWLDLANNEQGYRVYRDDALIATLGANITKYTDAPSFGGPYVYGVEAYNSGGVSTLSKVTESGCIP
ncbi:MAG: hypothetical protein HY864_04215 [Chloroflexi bacterium]|nr:hypothetical protein [Chloroflexota bacterium]